MAGNKIRHYLELRKEGVSLADAARQAEIAISTAKVQDRKAGLIKKVEKAPKKEKVTKQVDENGEVVIQ